MATPEIEWLAKQALVRVQDAQTGRVRVEDYLTVLASMTGEAALVASGVVDIESTDLAPGSRVFGDPINGILTGDAKDLDQVSPDTVVGVLVAELVPATYGRHDFEPLEAIYRRVAEGVGAAPWGGVAAGVPDGNQPTVLPIQVAFDLRSAVDAAVEQGGLPPQRRHVPSSQALAEGLRQVHGAIDPKIALTLSLDVVFTMAKTVPMSRKAFEQIATEAATEGGQKPN